MARTPLINPNPNPAAPAVPQTGYLLRDNNLSDLPGKAAARTALQLGAAAQREVAALGVATPGQLVQSDDPRLGAPIVAGQEIVLPVSDISNTVPFIWEVASTGSGAVTFKNFSMKVWNTSATPFTYSVRNKGGHELYNRGSAREVWNCSKEFRLSGRFFVGTGNAHTLARVTFGKVFGDGVGAIPAARKAVGFVVENLTIKGIVCNGNGVTGEVATAESLVLTANTVYDYRVVSLGNGTVQFYVNGVLLGTLAGGPTGNSAVQAGFQLENQNQGENEFGDFGIGPPRFFFAD